MLDACLYRREFTVDAKRVGSLGFEQVGLHVSQPAPRRRASDCVLVFAARREGEARVVG